MHEVNRAYDTTRVAAWPALHWQGYIQGVTVLVSGRLSGEAAPF
ncbi:hypothetical protein [uncultured Thermanaerothrix sp.]|nr:hypothetical protein [uncultured Thermanaerothrix sp.]